MSPRLHPDYLKVKPQRERAPGTINWDDAMYHLTPGLCRENSPLAPGDVVFVIRDIEYIKALVVAMSPEINRHEEWIPKYRVRLQNQDGSWSRKGQFLYPGEIE